MSCLILGADASQAKQALDDLDRQLWEIDESLCRAVLIELERAQYSGQGKSYASLCPRHKRPRPNV